MLSVQVPIMDNLYLDMNGWVACFLLSTLCGPLLLPKLSCQIPSRS